MILEEKTYEKFGYYNYNLPPNSAKRVIAKCDGCGKIRILRKCDYRSFCLSCVTTEKNHPNWKGGEIKRICKQCGKEFKVKRYLVEKGYGIFCSRKCLGEWKTKYRIGTGGANWKGGKSKQICLVCGKEFEIFPSRISNGRGKYCSYICARKAQKIPRHHTKPELIFEEICKNNNLPFKYTGDGAFWIGKNPAINPDFVECNGKKIAVEIFSYWHNPLLRRNIRYGQTYKGRKRILKKYGWKLVVFWQEDLERKDAERFILIELEKHGIISKDLYTQK